MYSRLVQFFSFFVWTLAVSGTDPVYNVNSLMDASLQSLSARVLASHDITRPLSQLTSNGYILTNPRLADLSTLRRAGDCWMWAIGQTVYINGSLTIGAMFIVGDSIVKPSGDIISEPLITVGSNSLDFKLKIWLDAKASCNVHYSLHWTSLAGVTLYDDTRSGSGRDLEGLVKTDWEGIGGQLAAPLLALLRDYGDLCQSKRLNQIEMIKYRRQYEDFHEIRID